MSVPIVFLHGWGQSKQIWQKQREAFPDALYLNLPGHGGATDSDDWITSIASQLPESPSLIVGWSLGGIIAMQLALKHPEKVASLALVASTPSFCLKQGWEHGCGDEMFNAFRSGIKTSSVKTMSRFFTLMFQGDEITRREYNGIAHTVIDKVSPPSEAGLKNGLELLGKIDLRPQLDQIIQPTLVMHGDGDAVIPTDAGRYLSENIPGSNWHLFEQCGHAPFLTQSEIFNKALEAWCHKL